MIQVSNLNIRYGKRVALEKVSFDLKEGECVVLAGANGSGKTTLLRAISGVLLFREGKVRVDGLKVGAKSRKKTAYIPTSLSFYDGLSLKEAIKLHENLYKDFAYKEVGSYPLNLRRKVHTLSKGEKTLFFLSLAVAASPDYLLIDDVIHFLDPHLREIFLKSILHLIETRGLSLVIAAQAPFDIEGIVDRVIVLDKGRIVLDESVEKLKKSFVRVFAEEIPEKLPVVYTKEWQGLKEFYIYPFQKGMVDDKEVTYLTLSEILRAYIGGEYDHN